MSSTIWAEGDVSLSPTGNLGGLRLGLPAAARAFYRWCTSAFLTIIVFAAIVAFIGVSFGVHLPFLEGSSQAAGAPVKPRLVKSAPAKNLCATPQTQSDPQFTSCPSFSLDYSKQTTGLINAKDFNVYNGLPVANHEAEYYTSNNQNLRIDNGSLVLEALNQSDQGYAYTSARIDTHGKEDFLYGKLVIRAILPDGTGTWPAIWMLPSQPKYASMSPVNDKDSYLNDGEIDIAESVGTQPHVVYGIAHSVAYPEDGPDRSYYSTVTVPDNNTVYHNYELDWTPTSLTFSIDGQPYYTYTKQAGADWHSWPFDQPYYLVVNLALGGSWGGTDTAQFPGDGIDKSALPAFLKVQSINYYSYAGEK